MSSTGFILCGTGENDVPADAAKTADWSSPGNIAVAGTSVATMNTFGADQVVPFIRASNFGFNIPSGATIDGVEVRIVYGASVPANYPVEDLHLAWGVSAANLSVDNNATGLAGNDTTIDYGGVSDTWGSSLTTGIINSSDFGMVVQFDRVGTTFSRAMRIEEVLMNVHYTEASNIAPGRRNAVILTG